MAFHVPFNQRTRLRNRPNPIYIGFEPFRSSAIQPRRARFNWWGFNGLWLSLASFLTAGFFSPVALLVSLIGLRRPARKMAIVGTVFSLLGIALATTIVGMKLHHHQQQQTRRQRNAAQRVLKQQRTETMSLLAAAKDELADFGRDLKIAPTDIELNMLVIKHVDPWGQSLRYDSDRQAKVVRSAGPDQTFETRDDLTVKAPTFAEFDLVQPTQISSE